MKGKKIALLLAGLALVSSTALAANTPYGLLDSSDKDSYAKIMVYQANDMNYYRYINSTYHYALDIPTEINKADENEGEMAVISRTSKIKSSSRPMLSRTR